MHQDPEEWQPCGLAALRRAGSLLENPQPRSLEACQSLLEEVRVGLRHAVATGGQLSPRAQTRLRAELTELRKLLLRTHLLLEQAAGFYSGWLRFKNSMTGGYTAGGEPVAVAAASRLSLEA
jgi:hypothetical protein